MLETKPNMTIFILSISDSIFSTHRLFEEGKKRGHDIKVINYIKCLTTLETGKKMLFYNGRNIVNEPHAIIPRIGVSVTQHGAAIVQEFESNNVYSTASASGITVSQNKAQSLQCLHKARLPIPKTVLSINPDDINNQIRHLGGTPLIIKLLEGTQGKGVMLAETNQSAKSMIESLYSMNTPILLQEFIKESQSEDIRVLVVDNTVVAAMKRKGPKNDFRSNIHLGGRGYPVQLTKEEEHIAIEAAQILNLAVAGVDIIRSKKGPLLMEVNSTPGLQGIETFTKVNVAEYIIKHIENSCS